MELAGFRTTERRNNVLNASGQLDLGSFKLDVGTVTEVVSVAAEGSTIETKNSDYSGLLTAKQIAQIQSRGRDVVNLLRLLPGVHYENDIEAMGDSFGSQIPNIGGQRKNWNQVTVDGLNGNELSGTNRMNSSINLDAIAEVKVLLNTLQGGVRSYAAAPTSRSSARAAAPTITAAAYWYGKRDAWNATPWENNRAGVAKPKLHIDTPGFNLGGPVKIPGVYDQGADKKLFFFYSFEAPQVQKPGPLRLYRMPTALERQGDFSQTFDANGGLIFVKDPLSSCACSVTAGGAGCFPGNIIPANRLDRNGLALLNLLPLPNALRAEPALQLHPPGDGRQSALQQPGEGRQAAVGRRTRSGRRSGRFARASTDRRSPRARRSGDSSTGPTCPATAASTAAGTTSSASSRVNELRPGVRRATEGFGTQTDADLTRILEIDASATRSAQFHRS